MKILNLVEFYEPVKGGAQEVVRQVSERLARRGHDVTVATTAVVERTFERLNGVRIVGFKLAGNQVRGIRGDPAPFLDFINRGDFDVILSYAAQTWHMDLVLQNIEALKPRVLLAACGFSALHDPAYGSYFDFFAERARHAHAVIVHSDSYRDANFLRQQGLGNLVMVPNGAGEEFDRDRGSTDFRTRHGIPHDRPLLLTVGSHTRIKGHAETISAFRRARIGTATLVLNGNKPPGARGCSVRCARQAALTPLLSFGRKHVRVMDLAREELVTAFLAADLFVFLSRIECAPLVLYEACAAGTPFVTCDVGNAAEIARVTGCGEVIETEIDAKGFSHANIGDAARAIARLIRDPQRRQDMGDAGRKAWRDRYNWEAITGRYEELYRAASGRNAAPAAPSHSIPS